ncbi:DUF6221 family protein [Actinoplanes sp. NPDC051851]|uniref:DUF6221 family protein n=1 Tax=Actinoplanes sp. NPDC051851 TaxID=3154753 RepID=UPI00342B0113
MTDDLIAFITARLDEDEQLASTAGAACGCHPGDTFATWTWTDPHIQAGQHTVLGGWDWTTAVDDEVGKHIAHWDPARALAEVETKRRILDLHAPLGWYGPNGPMCSTCGKTGRPGDEDVVVRWPCDTVRLLAMPYATHPDYHEEWRP